MTTMSTDSDDRAIDEDELLRPIPEELGINDASNESLILADPLPSCVIDEDELPRNIPGGDVIDEDELPRNIPGGDAIDEDELQRNIPGEDVIDEDELPRNIPGGDAIDEDELQRNIPGEDAIDEDELERNIPDEELGIEVASNKSLILADSRSNVGSKRTGSEDSESPNIDNTYNSECRKKPKFSEVSDENELRLVIIGKTGTGKSATGNSILGERDFFESKLSGTSVTNKCKLGITTRFNRKLVVVDTPGLHDTEMTEEEVTKEIVKCVGMTAPGPHAFLLTVNLGVRFTNEEQETIQRFVQHFGVRIYKYLLVVFTRADDLEDENTGIRNYVENCPTVLKTILKRCDHRYIPFNNKRSGNSQEQQVKNLIGSVDEIRCKHGGFCYTDEMFEEAEKNLQRREKEDKQKLVEEKQRNVENIKCHFQTEYDKKWELANEEKVKLEAEIKQINEENKDRIAQLQKRMDDNDRRRIQQMEDLRKVTEQKEREVQDKYRRLMEMLRDQNRIRISREENVFSQIFTGAARVWTDCAIM